MKVKRLPLLYMCKMVEMVQHSANGSTYSVVTAGSKMKHDLWCVA